MFDAKDLVLMIKQAARDTYNTMKPTEICYGIVEIISPLKIRTEQKILLENEQLILTRNVIDYDIELIESSIGPKIYTVSNALVQGEKVILIRVQGGQKYLVLDKVVDA